MTRANRHIEAFNKLNGKTVSVSSLKLLKSRIDKAASQSSDRSDLDALSRRLSAGILQAGEAGRVQVNIDKAKVVHYHHEDLTVLYGLECLQDDGDYDGKSLDGISDTTYKVVTDKIIAMMKAGGLVWRKPWKMNASSSNLAQNYKSKHVYSGTNFYLNWMNYPSPYFFTFKQVNEAGGKVKAGESGNPIVYFKWLYKDIKKQKLVDAKVALDKDGKLREGFEQIPAMFYYMVYNHSQTEGITIKTKPAPAKTADEQIESAEAIVNGMPTRPPIKHEAQDRAFYSPHYDSVTMPLVSFFDGKPMYYSVLFHELVHSTGSPRRLGRDLSGRKFDKKYCFEELIAEIGACFLCAESGILYHTLKNSAAYVKGYYESLLQMMKDDPRFFMNACSAAQKAADYILGEGRNAEKGKSEKGEKRKSFKPKARGKKLPFTQQVDAAIKEATRLAKARNWDEYQEKLKGWKTKFPDDVVKIMNAFADNFPAGDPPYIAEAKALAEESWKKMQAGEDVAPSPKALKDLMAKYANGDKINNKPKQILFAYASRIDELRREAGRKLLKKSSSGKEKPSKSRTAKKRREASVPGVKASVSAAIDDLVKNNPSKYGKKAMAMAMLYSTFAADRSEVVLLSDDELKFKLLDKEKWIELAKSSDLRHADYFKLSDKGAGVLDAIEGRLTSLRVKKQGGELFPDLKGASGLGFVSADKQPDATVGTFRLPGTIGQLLGELQRYKLEIVIAGETHSSKSELGKQIADAFCSLGDDVAWVDWEQGGLKSKDTRESIARNVKAENLKRFHVSSEVPRNLAAIKSLAKDFKVVALDSGTKLKEMTNAWIDELREQHPNTVWIILMQQNSKGVARGGPAAEFDAPLVLKTYRPDESDYAKNYAYVFKNRGNKTGQYYSISGKKILARSPEDPEPVPVNDPVKDDKPKSRVVL